MAPLLQTLVNDLSRWGTKILLQQVTTVNLVVRTTLGAFCSTLFLFCSFKKPGALEFHYIVQKRAEVLAGTDTVAPPQ